jgi:hypothetical protein
MLTVLSSSIPEHGKDEFRIVLNSLYHKGLTNTDANILGTLTSYSGLQLAAGRLSDSGKKLIRYLSDHENRLG